jgi:uncharacterized membrane protein YdjX (TVP38/TMEM64 family)
VENTTRNPLLIWAGAAIVATAAFMVLSAAFDKPGEGNDPVIAEIGNIGALIAFALLIVVAVVAVARAVRR